jgi:serine-type D-Ala-D-Ala carboxypeptidase/endopeptidase (penicillin-binding protein 4)
VSRIPRRILLGVLAAALAPAGCATAPRSPAAPSPEARLVAAFDSLADAPPLHRANWGIHVLDAATGRTLYDRNANRQFIPASNMKLVTGAAVLDRLGEDYRYTTQLLVGGRDGAAAEALVLVASGDPTWSTRFHTDATAPLDSMAALVADAGIRSAAELIIDASRFTDERIRGVWEVADLPWRWAAPVDAFAAAEATFRVVVTGAGARGEPATAHVIGPLPQPLRADITTDTAGAPARLRVDYMARTDTVYLSGSIGPGAADTSTLALTRPAESTVAALADALRRHGVRVGTVLVVRDTAAARLARSATQPLAEYRSAPLRDIVPAFMGPSQNWIAEQLLKTLGAELAGDGSWAGGLAEARAFVHDVAGIDSGAVTLRDGSGLSAQNLLAPAAVTALLMHARTRPWGPAFRDALPRPGQPSTTMAGRLDGLEDRVSAKTGTISNVIGLSGYITTADGRELVFSILANGTGLPSAIPREAIDGMVRVMAQGGG